MSNSTTLLDTIPSATYQPEVPANQLFDAGSPATLFANRPGTTGGTSWGYYGGVWYTDGVYSLVANGVATLVLPGSGTNHNYIECDRTGAVSVNQTGFTAGKSSLYDVTCNTAGPASWVDYRHWTRPGCATQRLVKAMPSDANYTLTAAESRCAILEFSGGSTLTATRNIVVPLAVQEWTVYNGTTGAQALQFIGASGTGITVANGKRARLYADGTNVVRVTPDT